MTSQQLEFARGQVIKVKGWLEEDKVTLAYKKEYEKKCEENLSRELKLCIGVMTPEYYEALKEYNAAKELTVWWTNKVVETTEALEELTEDHTPSCRSDPSLPSDQDTEDELVIEDNISDEDLVPDTWPFSYDLSRTETQNFEKRKRILSAAGLWAGGREYGTAKADRVSWREIRRLKKEKEEASRRSRNDDPEQLGRWWLDHVEKIKEQEKQVRWSLQGPEDWQKRELDRLQVLKSASAWGLPGVWERRPLGTWAKGRVWSNTAQTYV
jgi:hypothetical protein